MNGRYQHLWDAYYRLAEFYKVKPVLKELRHEWVRSIYFGEKIKDEPQKKDGVVIPVEPDKYDGIVINLPREIYDSQHNLRQVLIKGIYNNFDDLDPIRLNETTYMKIRTDLKKALGDIFKKMKVHLKKPYKVIYDEVLMQALSPLKGFLEINARLFLFESKYRTADERLIYDFKYRAYIDRFCVCLQELVRVLNEYHDQPLKYSPDVRNIFYKLNYEGWRASKIENWYLMKLEESL